MGKNKTAIEYLEREHESIREDLNRIKKYCSYLVTRLDMNSSEKDLLKALLNRW